MKIAVFRKRREGAFPVRVGFYLWFLSALLAGTSPALAASVQVPLGWNADPAATSIVAGLWPAEKVLETAVVDLDRDGVGEILIRFTDRCVAPQIENDLPNCAYGIVRHDGSAWVAIEQAPARDVVMYRSDDGIDALAFDGLAVTIVDGQTKVLPDFIFPPG